MKRKCCSNKKLTNAFSNLAKFLRIKCCDVCGDEKCRTLEVGDRSYETIPSKLIVEASFKALELNS